MGVFPFSRRLVERVLLYLPTGICSRERYVCESSFYEVHVDFGFVPRRKREQSLDDPVQILRRTLIIDYSSESAQSTAHTVQRIVHDMRQLSYDTVPGAVRSVAWIGCSHCIGSSGAIPPHIRQIIPAELYVAELQSGHVDYRIRAEYTAEYAVDHLVEFVRIEIHVYVAYACRRQIYVYARSQQSFYIQLSEHLCNTRDFFSRSLILRRRRRLSRRLFLSEIVRRVVDLLYKVFDRGSKHTENIQIKRKVGHEIRYVYRYET